MGNGLKEWGEDSPEIGQVYQFKNPIAAKSIRVPRGEEPNQQLLSKEEELRERTFMLGKLISENNGVPIFIGRKIPTSGRKKCKARYLFNLQN